MSTYGNCHCGAYRFELLLQPLPANGNEAPGDEKQTYACSCRACTKLGALWRPAEAGAVRAVHDDGKLVEFRSPEMLHKFCSVCGTTVLGSHLEGQDQDQGQSQGQDSRQQAITLVNLRALRGFNSFDLSYAAAVPSGCAAPDAPSSDAYQQAWPSTGSCLCGKVTVTLLAPLRDMPLKEDNCSICTRNAWVGAYPSKAQVSLLGTEHTRDYRFGRRFTGHPFCQTCGVHVYMVVHGPPQHIIDRLPKERKAMVRKNLDIAPVNVRVLDVPSRQNGLDIHSLSVQRTDEGQDGYEIVF